MIQKVKIQHDLSSNEVLHLREVEVYDQSDVNKALNGTASQSSEFEFSSLYPASKAVDGNVDDTDYADSNFSHTDYGSGKLVGCCHILLTEPDSYYYY